MWGDIYILGNLRIRQISFNSLFTFKGEKKVSKRERERERDFLLLLEIERVCRLYACGGPLYFILFLYLNIIK